MIVERRTFYAKVGKSREVANIGKQFFDGMKQAGLQPASGRILTDVTGKTDRVIVEIGYEQLRDFEETGGRLPTELTQGVLGKLAGVIDGADVEFLRVEYVG